MCGSTSRVTHPCKHSRSNLSTKGSTWTYIQPASLRVSALYWWEASTRAPGPDSLATSLCQQLRCARPRDRNRLDRAGLDGGTHRQPRQPEHVQASLFAALTKIGVRGCAVKIGMVATAPIAPAILAALATFAGPVVYDPVLRASSGGLLYDGDHEAILALAKRATLVTPNLGEAAWLLDRPVRTESDARAAACDLRAFGMAAVLVKGGHLEGEATDVLLSPAGERLLSSPRVAGRVRGNGLRSGHGHRRQAGGRRDAGTGSGLGQGMAHRPHQERPCRRRRTPSVTRLCFSRKLADRPRAQFFRQRAQTRQACPAPPRGPRYGRWKFHIPKAIFHRSGTAAKHDAGHGPRVDARVFNRQPVRGQGGEREESPGDEEHRLGEERPASVTRRRPRTRPPQNRREPAACDSRSMVPSAGVGQ